MRRKAHSIICHTNIFPGSCLEYTTVYPYLATTANAHHHTHPTSIDYRREVLVGVNGVPIDLVDQKYEAQAPKHS